MRVIKECVLDRIEVRPRSQERSILSKHLPALRRARAPTPSPNQSSPRVSHAQEGEAESARSRLAAWAPRLCSVADDARALTGR